MPCLGAVSCDLIAFRWLLAVNRRPVSYLNHLPFPNCNSNSGVLYIVFKRLSHISCGTLGFQCWGQVLASLVNSCICIPDSISSLHHIVWPLHVVDCVLVACLSCFGYRRETSSLTRSPFSLLSRIQSLTTLQARWSYPRNHYYLCYARLLALCYANATMPTTCFQASQTFHVKPLTHHVLANRWLAMLPLCSAPLIALLVAGEDWRSFLVKTFIYLLGYHHIILLS